MEKVECFLCTDVELVNLNISNTSTKYQNIPISSILHAFAGNDRIEIAITNADEICLICKRLLDELDYTRAKVQNIENIIAHKLHRKYRFDDIERTLPTIRLDHGTADAYTCGENNHKFQCTQCSYSTNFPDNLFPHHLNHQCADVNSENEIVNFPCQICRIILPSKILFNQHMATFHSPTKVVKRQVNLDYGNDDYNSDKNEDEIQEKPFQCLVSFFLFEIPKIT